MQIFFSQQMVGNAASSISLFGLCTFCALGCSNVPLSNCLEHLLILNQIVTENVLVKIVALQVYFLLSSAIDIMLLLWFPYSVTCRQHN